jgi:hypothetical protein
MILQQVQLAQKQEKKLNLSIINIFSGLIAD